MADLFSASREEVMRHLILDPGLAPLALEAAAKSKQREHTGAAMTAIGWTLVGVGLTVAAAALMPQGFTMSCGDGCETTENKVDGQGKIVGVSFGAAVLGLAVAVPGMTMLRKTSDIENQAISRYQQKDTEASRAPARSYSGSASLASPRRGFQIPLLSFRF